MRNDFELDFLERSKGEECGMARCLAERHCKRREVRKNAESHLVKIPRSLFLFLLPQASAVNFKQDGVGKIFFLPRKRRRQILSQRTKMQDDLMEFSDSSLTFLSVTVCAFAERKKGLIINFVWLQRRVFGAWEKMVEKPTKQGGIMPTKIGFFPWIPYKNPIFKRAPLYSFVDVSFLFPSIYPIGIPICLSASRQMEEDPMLIFQSSSLVRQTDRLSSSSQSPPRPPHSGLASLISPGNDGRPPKWKNRRGGGGGGGPLLPLHFPPPRLFTCMRGRRRRSGTYCRLP